MLGKIADTILSQIEKLENENKELQDTIANEKAMQTNYSYADIRKWLSHFRTLDYSKTKNRKALIDIFIYKVILYDDKMKVLFHLKNGQKNELLLNLIFPDYPDGNRNTNKNGAKKKKPINRFLSRRGVRIPLLWCTFRVSAETPQAGSPRRSVAGFVELPFPCGSLGKASRPLAARAREPSGFSPLQTYQKRSTGMTCASFLVHLQGLEPGTH